MQIGTLIKFKDTTELGIVTAKVLSFGYKLVGKSSD